MSKKKRKEVRKEREERKEKEEKNETIMPDNKDKTQPPPTSALAGNQKTWIIISAVLFVACVAMLIYTMDVRGQLSDCNSNLINCGLTLDEAIQQGENDAMELRKLQHDIDGLSLKNAGKPSIPEKHVKRFQDLGLARPVPTIMSELYRNKEIFPYEASGEGKYMRFSNRNEIFVLSPDRVLAYFTDGTIFGWMFLQYKVKEGGKISWKVVESYCPYYDK